MFSNICAKILARQSSRRTITLLQLGCVDLLADLLKLEENAVQRECLRALGLLCGCADGKMRAFQVY